MGIRHLETFMEKIVRVSDINITELSSNTNSVNRIVAVDGLSCCHVLYENLNWLCGGQFKEFKLVVEKFIQKFNDLGCRLAVFIDGSVQEEKLNNWKISKENRAKVISNILKYREIDLSKKGHVHLLPNGLVYLFIDILNRNGNCKVIIAKEECDKELALYVYNNKCMAILAQDSDFIIFDYGEISPVYLSLNHFNLDSMITKCYDSQKLAEYLKIDKKKLPLFASLAGNDIILYDDVTEFHQLLRGKSKSLNEHYFLLIAEYIKEQNDTNLYQISQDVFGSENRKEDLEISIRSYNVKNRTLLKMNLPEEIVLNCKANKWLDIVQFIKEDNLNIYLLPLYNIAVLGRLLNADCLESYHANKQDGLPNIGVLMKELRRSLYGIILYEKSLAEDKNKTFVSEFVYTGPGSLHMPVHVNPKYLTSVKHPGLIALLTSQDPSIDKTKWKILDEIFDCDTEHLYKIFSPNWLVPIISARYLKKHFKGLRDSDLFAILATNFHTMNRKNRWKFINQPVSYRSIWLYSAITRIYMDVATLLFTIKHPINRRYTLPDAYTDGNIFHKVYTVIQKNCIESIYGKEMMKDLYCMKQIVEKEGNLSR